MGETEEIAKAIQESTKLGQRGLETAEKVASFFAKVFKAPVDEVSGMITDKLRFLRFKRLIEISEEVDRILEEKGIKNTRAVPPKLALPILEGASLEEDSNIKQLWNHLLANAMNPAFNSEIRYGFIDMIKGITAREAGLLNALYGALEQSNKARPLNSLHQYVFYKEGLIEELSLSADDYAISVNNLMRMQLIGPAILKGGISFRFGDKSEAATVYKGIDAITVTPLGVLFIEACIR